MTRLPLQEQAGWLSERLGPGLAGHLFRALYWRIVGRILSPDELPPPGMGYVGIPWSGFKLTADEVTYAQDLQRELEASRP